MMTEFDSVEHLQKITFIINEEVEKRVKTYIKYLNKHPDIFERELKSLRVHNTRLIKVLEMQECHCSSSTGEFQTKGPDNICDRCEVLGYHKNEVGSNYG